MFLILPLCRSRSVSLSLSVSHYGSLSLSLSLSLALSLSLSPILPSSVGAVILCIPRVGSNKDVGTVAADLTKPQLTAEGTKAVLFQTCQARCHDLSRQYLYS